MTTKIIHFDSNNSVNNPSTVIDPTTGNSKTVYHSFNTIYALPTQLQSVKNIYLKSLELPVTFCNIRPTMSPLSYTYTNTSGGNLTKTFTQVLPEASYADIYAVVTALNTFINSNSPELAFNLLGGETIPVFSVVTLNGDLRVSYSIRLFNTSTFTLKEGFLTKTLLGYVASNDTKIVSLANRYKVAGTYQISSQTVVYQATNNALTIVNDITTATTTNVNITYYANPTSSAISALLIDSTTTFSNPCNINYDTYVNMTLSNLPVITANNNQFSCTFKIPINSTSNIVYLNGESNSFIQSVNIGDSHFILDKLIVVFTDRRGFPIQPNYGQYSFSIGINFDDTFGETTNGNSGTGSSSGGNNTGYSAGYTPPPLIHYFNEF